MLTRSVLCLLAAFAAQAATVVKTQDLKLPLEFEANRGQFTSEVLYLARTPRHFVYLTQQGMTLGLSESTRRGAALQMKFVGARVSAAVAPESRLQGVSNYYIGSDSSHWQRGVPHYQRIRYRSVWRGIDVVFHGRDQALEYDFDVSPGADASAIRLTFANATRLRIDSSGSLMIDTADVTVVQRLPEIYQESAGVRRPVRGNFRIAGDREVRFEVAAYDRRRPLVIDPTITFSTYIGGTGTVTVGGIAVDGSGISYVTGSVSSPDFPLVSSIKQFPSSVGLFRSSNQGSTWGSANANLGTAKVLTIATDPSNSATAYAGTSHGVFKTTSSGSVWTAVNTGLPNDTVTSVAVDPLSTSTIYACMLEGLYKSVDSAATWKLLGNAGAPTAVAIDSKREGTLWLVYSFGYPVVSLDGGSTLLQANYPQILGTSVAVDPNNSLNVFYGTSSLGLLMSTNSGQSFTSANTGLAATAGSAVTVNAIAINPHNSTRILVGTNTGVYVSSSGGNSFQATQGLGNREVLSVLFDPTFNNIALAGTAGGGVYASTDGGQTWTPTGPSNLDVNALAMSADEQSTWAGLYSGGNAYVTAINPAGTAIVYSTYLGGSGNSVGAAVGVDTHNHTFICGTTDASDFPVQNAHQTYAGGTDMFVTRLNSSGSLDASTFLGGRADDVCTSLAVDLGGSVYVTGSSILLSGNRSDFPTTPGVFGAQSFGGQDCVVTKFDNALQNLVYSTFLGGNNADNCYAIAADSSGNAYVAGATFSTDFPTTQSPYGGTTTGGSMTNTPAFVTKIKPDGTGLVYSGLLGGSHGATQINGIAVNAAGQVFVTGYTSTSDYPVTGNAMSKTFASPSRAVVTAISADGAKLVYSTFLPGSHADYGSAIALDANSNAWVSGVDFGTLQVTPDAIPHTVAPGALFSPWVVEVDPTGSSLLHATYVGGSAGGLYSFLALGPNGSVYAAGTTLSTDFSLTGTPFKQVQATDFNVYVLRLAFSTGTTPTISSVQNGASFQNGFAAGSWLTIKGSNLASTTDTWDNFIVNGQLPTKLDGVTVSVGGQPAYVYFVSPGQINVVAPNVAAGPVSVIVTNSFGTSAGFPATAQTAQPAFFLWNNTYAVATRQDFSYAAKNGTFPGTTTVAAKPGDVIILWGTGFGPTTPAAPSGTQTPISSFPTANAVTVTIGNQTATVYGAALASGFAALYQVAIQIPTSLADGDYPVVATVAGQSSPVTAMISVQH